MSRRFGRRTIVISATALSLVAGSAGVGVAAYVTHRHVQPEDDDAHEAIRSAPLSTTGSCGVERWSVKTGTDADAGLINLSSPQSTTIANLDAIPAPSSLPSNNRVRPTETTVYVVNATLTQYKLETDSDYHLVLSDGGGHTMIAEIPDPACVGSSSPLLPSIRTARSTFDAKYTATGSFKTANVPVTVKGVGFFDFNHGQTGVAPNAIELHAVLDVQFGGGGGGNTVTVTNPGNQSSAVGQSVSVQVHASDSGGAALTYSASGLPTGTSIGSSTGLISGTTSAAGTYSVTVTARDSTGASGSTAFTWTVSSGGGCTGAGQKLGNPGFETGSAAPWSASSGVIAANGSRESAHSGTYFAWLDGYGTTTTDTLSQPVTIPSGCTTYTLSFWLHIDTAETTTTTKYDTLTVTIGSTTLATYSNLNHGTGYSQKSFNVGSYAGQTVTLTFTGSEDSSYQTSFVVDDTALNVS